MSLLRIFVSSVQKEFSQERQALHDYLRGDPLMRRFFEVFLSGDFPTSDRRPDELYLDEVERCDLYVGLVGNEYGTEDKEGISATEREFDRATALGAHRLIFVKGSHGRARHRKIRALMGKTPAGLIRKRFDTREELVRRLHAALVEYLEVKELIRPDPFDALPCARAALDDLDFGRMARFIRTARQARRLPLSEDVRPMELLAHLNLLNDGRVTNAAMLLFGNAPQQFLISSEIECAHFHGTEVVKPIPLCQVYKGAAFNLVDKAVDFALGRIALAAGVPTTSSGDPVTSEIPKEVVTEAIVNAVAHRDYRSNNRVQVRLFADRLEVWNPSRLSPLLPLEKLRVAHGSAPTNPLLAGSLYLAKYIEQMGTGTLEMIRRCSKSGLPEPEFSVADGFVTTFRRAPLADRVTVQPESPSKSDLMPGQSDGHTGTRPESNAQLESRPEMQPESNPKSRSRSLKSRVFSLLVDGPMSKSELSRSLGQKQVSGQLNKVVRRLVTDETVEYAVPDKPRSQLLKYRLTDKGRSALAMVRSGT